MVGPTSIEQKDKEDLSTTQSNFEMIFHAARRLIPAEHHDDVREALEVFSANRKENVGAKHERDPTVFSQQPFFLSADGQPVYEVVPKDLILGPL